MTDVKAFELGKRMSYGQQNGDYKPRLKESVDVNIEKSRPLYVSPLCYANELGIIITMLQLAIIYYDTISIKASLKCKGIML
ncbi:MAG TPA: hypothetical protein VFQ47_07335, partial [Nitrososphaera sp.]|nr:hypothetical protein [Nitrososphaera sp.]